MKIKSIVILILSYSSLAGVGDLGNDFKVSGLGDLGSNFRARGTNDLGNDFKGSGSEAIISYYENLKDIEKNKRIIELPKKVKVEIDRDFISPINRWTLKTKHRDLLAKDMDQLKSFDSINLMKQISGLQPTIDNLKLNGFKNKDF